MNKIKQHSALWRTFKAHYLGANDCASILGHGFQTVDDVIRLKTSREQQKFTAEQQARMDHGTRFESLVRTACANRNSIVIHETGMKFHKQHKFLTASPDGLYIDDNGQKILTEFKVLSCLSDQVPYKYWIQMQIQMAVWGLDKCLYCENVVTSDGVISEYREEMITVDHTWFKQVEEKIVAAWNKIEDIRKQNRGRKRKEEEQTDLPSVTTIYPRNLVNYVRKDALLDWLELYGHNEQKDRGRSMYLAMLTRLKHEFADRVRKHIWSLYENMPGFVYDVDDVQRPNNNCAADRISVNSETLARTRDAMAIGAPIIFNAVFQVEERGCTLVGVADMLVLNHYLESVFNIQLTENMPEDKYTLVQFKYATMDLRVDGKTLLNNDKQRAYKAQLWFVNRLLGKTQEHTAEISYIIGRRYASSKFKYNNAFGHICAVIHADDEEKHNNALDWQIMLRTDATWRTVNPRNCTELFPNMKNHNDAPWHGYKVAMAQEIKDITLMYRCGPNVRQRAHEKGITTWQDIDLKGITQDFIAAQTETPGTRVAPIPTHRLRFFVDFESTGSFYDDFSTFPLSGDNNHIFLIGVFAEDTVTKETQYFSYVAEKLDSESEQRILHQMFSDIKSWAELRGETTLPLYYWSNAEKYMIDRALGPDYLLQRSEVELVDLCKVFREARVILPNQFGFGLKEIGLLMKKYGMIETCWDESYDISNGVDAMVEAIRAYKYPKVKKTKDFFREVINYNYVDCKIMQEIVNYMLRTNRTNVA